MKQILLLCVLVSAFVNVLCETCTNPQVTSKSFTTQDATIVTNIAYIVEFTVNCGSAPVPNLYVDVDGNIMAPSSVGPNTFQISWTQDPKVAPRGERELKVYDESGYAALRKANRAGEDTSAVPSIFTVSVNHPGAYSGPWFKSEFLATVITAVVAYIAVYSRTKITA